MGAANCAGFRRSGHKLCSACFQWRMENGNSVLSGRMSSELIKELADVAYSLLKADRRAPGRKRKKPKISFMDYDDAMRAEKEMAVEAPAPMVMLNIPLPSLRQSGQNNFFTGPLPQSVNYQNDYSTKQIPNIHPGQQYALPPEGISHHKRRR